MIREKKEDLYWVVSHMNTDLHLGLSESDREEIETYLNDKYMVFKRENRIKPNPLWRLTAPFFLVLLIGMILYMPILWIFTGDYQYSVRNKFYIFFKNWYERLF